jgi:D-tagatose-1,6-bisphosphate aldolase subunit GatZ/KbaZ
VIAAAARYAKANDSVLHIESTSSQVNQFGGYTAQNPEHFASFVRAAAADAGLPYRRILLGGDHLGPFPWRDEPAAVAMEKANVLVRDCVLAGYQKIHLDASMACSDDSRTGPDERTIADRAAQLCATAEHAFCELAPPSPPLLYVVGTEVPTPGGESQPQKSVSVTTAEHIRSTLQAFKRSFENRGLTAAWERVIGLVVQPGVEFGESNVFDYDREKTKALAHALPASPLLVYEAHSTDYQLLSSLKKMVEDHFAILKVGPELTSAFREAIFALSAIEAEILRGKAARISDVRHALESAMLRNPSYWRDYYHGDENQLRLSRFYSFSDRCRYYWYETEVKAQIDLLIGNLTKSPPPLTIIGQYLPVEYEAIRAGRLQASPSEMVRHHIQTVLHKYATACGGSQALL